MIWLHTHSHPLENIIHHMINVVLGNTLLSKSSGIYMPHILQDIALTFHLRGDIKEMGTGIVHPITKETMTKYAKIIKVS